MTRKIAWFASFGVAVTVALSMRSLDFDWLATFVTAAVTCIVLPDMLLGRAARSPGLLITDGLAGRECNAASRRTPALKSAPDILERLRRNRGVAHGIRDRSMPQEVLEPPCVHSPGRQCVSGRMPQHVDTRLSILSVWNPVAFIENRTAGQKTNTAHVSNMTNTRSWTCQNAITEQEATSRRLMNCLGWMRSRLPKTRQLNNESLADNGEGLIFHPPARRVWTALLR
jgi:hypothetical protein